MPCADLHLTDWASIAQMVLAVAAVLALGGAIGQTLSSRSATRASITFGFTTRFADPELLPYIQKTIEVFTGAGTPEEKFVAYGEMDYAEQLATMVVPNLMEELAGLYNRGLLDEKITRDFFGDLARDLWISGSWLFVPWREDDPAYFAQWLLMLRRMKLVD